MKNPTRFNFHLLALPLLLMIAMSNKAVAETDFFEQYDACLTYLNGAHKPETDIGKAIRTENYEGLSIDEQSKIIIELLKGSVRGKDLMRDKVAGMRASESTKYFVSDGSRGNPIGGGSNIELMTHPSAGSYKKCGGTGSPESSPVGSPARAAGAVASKSELEAAIAPHKEKLTKAFEEACKDKRVQEEFEKIKHLLK